MQQIKRELLRYPLETFCFAPEAASLATSVNAKTKDKGRVVFGVIGVLLASAIFSFLFAYLCTTFLLAQFNVQRRMLLGQKSLLIIIGSNIVSLVLLWIVGFALLSASGRSNLEMPAALIAIGAQSIWLLRHLWRYRRDHLRVRYEAYDPEIGPDTLTRS
jgi:hypothetical protein